MARIRTIKPEFPQSQSMSRVSREARLTFILLWPQCDDHGKFRGASRMLASLLYPYDDDAPSRIEGWLEELEREHCIERYTVDGNDYLRIINWLEHQKVDRPSKSKFPDPSECSRMLSNAREASSQDQGPRTKDQGPSSEAKASAADAASEPDMTKAAFDSGVRLLGRNGISESQARGIIGRWRKDHGDGAVLEALGKFQHAGASEPVSYITACLKAAQRATGPPRGSAPWNG